MKNIINSFQKIMLAATFAEAGEWNTAREMTPDVELSKEPTWLDRIFMAVTFAESGLRNDAIRFLELVEYTNRGFNSTAAHDLGLHGIRLTYGTVTI